MDMSRIDLHADTHADSQQFSLREVVDQVRQAIVAIEQSHKQLQDNVHDGNGEALLRQVAQSSAVLPVLLNNQLRMIESLEQQFLEQFTSHCPDEIQEIGRVAQLVRSAMESASANIGMDTAEQSRIAQCVFGSTSRLNILQQRIAGKMMKIKKNS